MTSAAYGALHASTILDAYQAQALLSQQRMYLESENNTGLRRRFVPNDPNQQQFSETNAASQEEQDGNILEEVMMPRNDQAASVDDESPRPRQALVIDPVVGVAAGMAGKVALDLLKHFGPEFLSWFKSHLHKVNNTPPPKLTLQQVQLISCKLVQYGVPLAVGGVVVWQIATKGANAQLIVAGCGMVLSFLATYRHNDVAAQVLAAEQSWITQTTGGQALNLGLTTAIPELAASAGVTTEQFRGLIAQAEAQQGATHWYDCITNCFSCWNREADEEAQRPARRWYQCFTDCCGCGDACGHIFRR